MILAGWPIPEPHSDCGVTDCGNRRCDRCDERLMCTGPVPETDNTCRDCAFIRRATARATAAWDAADQPQPHTASHTWADVWADHWAEQRAEDRAYELAQLEDREEVEAS